MSTRESNLLAEFIARVPDLASHKWYPEDEFGNREPYPSIVLHDDAEIGRRAAAAILSDPAVLDAICEYRAHQINTERGNAGA